MNKQELEAYRDLWRGHAKVHFKCGECNVLKQKIACPLPVPYTSREIKQYTHVCLARWQYWKKKWELK